MPTSSSRRSSFRCDSVSKEASNNDRGRRGSFSSQSHPSTISSSTHVSEDKVMRLKRHGLRSSSRSRPLKESSSSASNMKSNRNKGNAASHVNETSNDKKKKVEGASSNVLQSPTPYWKVAKERGGVCSPPETRSHKKKKMNQSVAVNAFSSEVKAGSSENTKAAETEKVLEFSSPTAGNIGLSDSNSKRTNGIVLTFSPPDQVANALREKEEEERKNIAWQSRCQDEKDKGHLMIFSPTMRNPAPIPPEHIGAAIENEKKSGQTISEEAAPTPQKMDLEKEFRNMKTPVSSFASSVDTTGVASELKKVQESLVRIESLTIANNKLEKEQKDMESKLSSAHQLYMTEKSRIESEFEARNSENMAKIDELKTCVQELEGQLNDLQEEKVILKQQVSDFEKDTLDARNIHIRSEKALKAMKEEWEADKNSYEEQAMELHQANAILSQQLKGQNGVADELKKVMEKNTELQALIKKNESHVDKLQNILLPESELQLEKARETMQESEETISKLTNKIKQYEELLKNMKKELSLAKSEKEEERINFQKLNEDSNVAVEEMKQDVAAKDRRITDLTIELNEIKDSLELEKREIAEAADSLKGRHTALDSRILELEKSLEETMNSLESSERERSKLSTKLQIALEQIEADSKFKASAVSKHKEASEAMNEMELQRNHLQSRVDELESQLQLTKDERDDARNQLDTFDDREAELFRKLRESDRVRRGLHNRVMQLSGNIRVYVRVRPALPNENNQVKASDASPTCAKKRKHDEVENTGPFRYPGIYDRDHKKSNHGVDDLTKNLLEVTEPYKDRGGLSDRRKKWTFGFDNVFTPDHNQQDLWKATEPLVQSAIDGYNVTVFAYGQTGSGKTFTMLGEPGNEGLVSRSVQKLFQAKTEIELLTRGESQVGLSVELLEIYNEKVRDLLVPNSGPDGRELSLKVSSSAVVGNVVVAAKSERHVSEILDLAQKRRCVKATASNEVSSRSHMLFTIHFNVTAKDGIKRSGKLNVCDLAGSERLSKSNANSDVGGALLTETKHINKSLSCLSNVIEKLQSKDANIPYRESKLTYLLQNSLGGNSKTLAIVCCNPLTSHFHESLCSLRFAAKVNKVDLKAVANFSC